MHPILMDDQYCNSEQPGKAPAERDVELKLESETETLLGDMEQSAIEAPSSLLRSDLPPQD